MKVAVTGAFGYTGRYVATRLLAHGHDVVTLTNSPNRGAAFEKEIRVAPLAFDKPAELAESLCGADALINTYWVRFNHRLFTHAEAVKNTQTLFQAAKSAGVKRIVHVSITNPDANSDLTYFRGKAELERNLAESGVAHSIVRPGVVFGKEDILINNIAWALRRLPVFGLFGDGGYKLQPIYVDDFAKLLADACGAQANETIDAIGPETFTFKDLVETIARILSVRSAVVPLPPSLAYAFCRLAGAVVKDVIITDDEVKGLMRGHLFVDGPPTGATALTEWLAANRQTVGLRYTSEILRRIDRNHVYQSN